MRRTTMRRGAVSSRLGGLKTDIAAAIAAQGVAAALSRRVAFQLVFKIDERDLADRTVWSAIGRALLAEVSVLKDRVGLVDRQIAAALPKLSAADLTNLLAELQAADRRIARTIFNASFTASAPQRKAIEHLKHIDGVSSAFARLAALGVESEVTKILANSSRFRGHLRSTEPTV